jgi:hypothetical protein
VAQDECAENAREEFISLIQALEHSVRFLITSRPNVDLRARFTNLSQIQVSARGHDIEMYLEHKISKSHRMSLFTAKDKNLKADIVKTVTQRSTGM